MGEHMSDGRVVGRAVGVQDFPARRIPRLQIEHRFETPMASCLIFSRIYDSEYADLDAYVGMCCPCG